jgi:hypothetical protein
MMWSYDPQMKEKWKGGGGEGGGESGGGDGGEGGGEGGGGEEGGGEEETQFRTVFFQTGSHTAEQGRRIRKLWECTHSSVLTFDNIDAYSFETSSTHKSQRSEALRCVKHNHDKLMFEQRQAIKDARAIIQNNRGNGLGMKPMRATAKNRLTELRRKKREEQLIYYQKILKIRGQDEGAPLLDECTTSTNYVPPIPVDFADDAD